MAEIGSLIIKLQAETAQFREDMGKVKGDLADLKDQGEGASGAFGFQESRGGLMLTEDLIGVRLPRHLNSLIAQIPGVGAAFAAMLPIAGALVFVEIIAKLVEKHEALARAVNQARDAAANLAVKQDDGSKQIEITNLKLDDQIARLEHKPAHNYLKEAIIETSVEVDHLLATYSADFAQMNKAVEDHLGFWHELGRGIQDAWTGQGQGKGYGIVTAQLEAVQKAEVGVNEARAKLAGAPPGTDAWKAAEQGVVAALHAKLAALQALQPAYKSDAGMMVNLSSSILSVTNELKNLNTVIDETAPKKIKIASLEQGEANLKPLQDEAALQKIAAQGAYEHDAALRKLAQTQAETATAGSKNDPQEGIQDRLNAELKAIETEHKAAVDAANDEAKEKKAVYDADIKAAGANAQKKKELNAEYLNSVRKTADEIAQADADAERKSVEAVRDAENQKKEAQIKTEQEAADGVLKITTDSAKKQEKLAQDHIKFLEEMHRGGFKQETALEVQAAQAAVDAEVKAYDARIKALDKYDKDYLKKVQDFENQKKKVIQDGEAQITQIQQTALQKEQLQVQQAYNKMYESIASSIAKDIVMNKSLAQSFRQLGEEMAEGMIKNLILAMLMHDKNKLVKAKDAAVNSYDWASSWGGPIAGAAAAALSFAAVMSFEVGGKIPGSGAVPIVGHGGETVVTRALTDRVEAAEARGGNSYGDMHMHNTYAPQVHAVDAEGVDKMLEKHHRVFERRITSIARKMNKGIH